MEHTKIQLTDLHKYYNKGRKNEIHVINGTTLSLPDKGFVCILGESGSGKTTLLNTMGGLDDYVKGKLAISGDELKHYSSRKIDRIRTAHCSYIFQNYYLLQDHTVEYNIRLALNMYEISEEEKNERIDYVLQAVDMQKYKKRQVSKLSGGQQQRIAIARALVKTPEIIFADEPTGNLDEANTMRIMQILKKISKNCLVIMVTHEKRLASFFADRIIQIESGKVKSDEQSQGNGEFAYQSENTFYLNEYEEIAMSGNNVKVHCYTKDEMPELVLRVIYENGNYYVKADDDKKVTFLTEGSDRKLLFEDRPMLKEEDLEEFDYQLESLPGNRMPRLGFMEIMRLAMHNLKLLGKKQVFLIVCFLAMAVLMVLTVADIATLATIDVRSLIHSDSHYVSVEARRHGELDERAFNEQYEELLDKFLATTSMDNVLVELSPNLRFEYKGFSQIKDVNALLSGYTIAYDDRLQEEWIIYGEMPKNSDEIVIDIRVLENFLAKDSIFAQLIPNPEYFVGETLDVEKKEWGLKIVGICDSGEPNIYMDKCTHISTTTWLTNTFQTVERLQELMPERYKDTTLTTEECIIRNHFYGEIDGIGNYYSSRFVKGCFVVDIFPEEYPFEVVISQEKYEEVLKSMLVQAKKMLVYTDDKEATMAYLRELEESTDGMVELVITDLYAKEYSVYEEARALKLDARMVITITIVAISLVVLYFSMKSCAIKNIQNIAVYRLLGIKKGSIGLIYAAETAFLTTFTSLPAVLATSVVLKFIASVPSLEMTLVYPWWAVFATLAFLYFVNCLAGILPILGILRLPPAKLAAKYGL